MDYSKGYTVAFKTCTVNKESWSDEEWLGNDGDAIVSGSINRTEDYLRDSASLTLRDFYSTKNQGSIVDMWVRVYMDIDQGGSKTREAIFTGLATSPGVNYNNGVYDVSVDCYSVLKPAEDIILSRGYYIPAGSNGIGEILDLLKVVPSEKEYPTDILTSNDAAIEYSIVAEDNETNLSMVEKILNVIRWKMQVLGDGTLRFSKIDDDAIAATLSPENDVIETNFSMRRDWFNSPNVFKAVYGDFVAIAKDEDPDSMLSIPRRGREIWMVENSISLEDGQSLAEYAEQRLKEEQSRAREVSYSRRFLPDVYPGDLIKLNYDQLYGYFNVDSQTITLGHAGVTSEQLSEVV